MLAKRLMVLALFTTAAMLPAAADAAIRPLPIQVEVRARDTGDLVPATVRILYWEHPEYLFDGGVAADGTLAPDRRCALSPELYVEATPLGSGYGKGFRTCYDPQPLIIYVDPR
jgi:hypothetical protein